jgi:diguanylate cyclase (GGDEF)-like protein/PAS domain S-box-containing protein
MPLIVIVDDRATNRAIFSKLVGSLSDTVEVEAFSAPGPALEWIETKTPDLVITDYKMPQMTGAKFTQRIRALPNGADVPIIVITAYDDRDYRLQALEAGATDFVQTPIDHQEFITRARNLLQLGTRQKLIRNRAHELAQELHDIEQERQELLRDSRDRLAQVIDTVPAMISASDRHGDCVFVNAFQVELLGPTGINARGRAGAFEGEHGKRSRQLDGRVFATGQPLPAFEEEVEDASGARRVFLTTKTPLKSGPDVVSSVLTTSLDITERKRAERYLHHLAHHDPLTGLPNRLQLHLRLQDVVDSATFDNTVFALHFLDLDRFKSINDAFGHHTGDALLIQVADRLRRLVRSTDTIARLGGDEFAIIQTGLEGHTEAEILAARITRAFADPFSIGGRAIGTSCSLGITLFPGDGMTLESLLKTADLAMYRAKAQGRNRYCTFAPEMQAAVREAAQLEIDLRAGLLRSELILHYQPQVDTRTRQVTGCEALVRWNHPKQGLLPPGRFLALAEEAGLMNSLNIWVLDEACRQAAAWEAIGMPTRVAINLSASIFRQYDVAELVKEAVTRFGVSPRLIDIELTETTFLDDHATARRQLLELQALGISFSVDDFGTGYASFTYIETLPVNRLKIDQAFIQNIANRNGGSAIIRAIIGLGRGLGLRVVAEGVETEAQLRELVAEGCDEVQGYLFSRPLPAAEFEAFARAHGRGLALAGMAI